MKIAKNLAIAEQYLRELKFEKAEELCQKILQISPENLNAALLLGASYLKRSNYAESKKIYEHILSKDPDHLNANNDLGVILLNYKDFVTAEKYFKKVNEIDPSHVNSLINLANISYHREQWDSAESLYRKALLIQPNNGAIINNLVQLLIKQGRLVEGANLIERISDLSNQGPSVFTAYLLANHLCKWDIADRYRETIVNIFSVGSMGEDYLSMLSLHLLSDPKITNEIMFEIARKSAEDYEKRCPPNLVINHEYAIQSLKNGGKLRIGYLSGDFYLHVCTNFVRSLINYYDKDHFEVICYSNTPKEDEVTLKYKSNVDAFIDIRNLSDLELSEKIQKDGIHILVDLSGYTSGNRISVMCYHPAPIQITYLGYPYSTGFSAIDYILSDPYLDGPLNEKYCSEKPLRLPEAFCAFGELQDEVIEQQIAFERHSNVTFGSLINTYKLNPEIIRAWSRILQQSDNSRLILNHPNYHPDITRQNILKEFSKNGISENRIRIIWKKLKDATHLYYYNDIDIALDLFPMTGGQTTIDALWMGVPVVTLVGETHHQRISYMLLKNLSIDVDDLIAFNEEEYIQKAVELSKSKNRIKDLHRIIPEALSQSVLCDPLRFSAQLEATYIAAWNKKFPEIPYNRDTRKHDFELSTIKGDVKLAVSPSIDDRFSYVIKEQKGWFDPEYDFVLGMIQPSYRAIDINSEIGAYAVPMARKTNGIGKTWAISLSIEHTRYLEKSKDLNNLVSFEIINNVRMGNLNLDFEMIKHGWNHIDFVRINSLSGEKGLFGRGSDFFSRLSPLVMFGIKINEETNFFIEECLSKLNYDTYRLIPGIDLLIPFDSSKAIGEIDDFCLNLFCCKQDRAERLHKDGLLLLNFPATDKIPGFSSSVLIEYLSALPYTHGLLDLWINNTHSLQGWDTYFQALSLFAASKTKGISPEQKYYYLRTSLSFTEHIVASHANVSRVLSLARILMDMGKRFLAVKVLDHLAEFFETGKGNIIMDINEPFLALSDSLSQINPGERIAEWIYASTLEQRERLRAFSSYYTGVESLDIFDKIEQFGFLDNEMENRRKLIRLRHRIA